MRSYRRAALLAGFISVCEVKLTLALALALALTLTSPRAR